MIRSFTSASRLWRGALRSLLPRRWSKIGAIGERLRLDEQSILIVCAVVVGVLAAAGTVAFYAAIDAAYALVFRWTTGGLSLLPRLLYQPLITSIALVAAFLLWRRVGAGDDGLTVPDVQLAVVRRGGRVSLRKAVGRTMASVVTIGGGGSAGSEGPVAVLGAALASRFSRVFRFAEGRTRVIVAAGAAAGISAAFNAPLAGAFFALEEILGTFRGDHFAPVVIASVTAAVMSRAIFGNHPVFSLPERYSYDNALEVLWAFPLLGIACGLVAALFVRLHFSIGARLSHWRQRARVSAVVAAVGGGAVGAAVALSAGVLVGTGHLAIPLERFAAMSAIMLVLLTLGKILITSITLQAGGSGGVFTPSLFTGAALGSALAIALHRVVPGFTSAPEAYALVGMGAMVAATTGAPITATLLVFEITGDYAIMLPLMTCVAISQLIARRITRDTLYSGWLRRRGERIDHGRDGHALDQLVVRAVQSADAPVVFESASMSEVIDCFATGAPEVLPVVDATRRLIGVLTATEIGALAKLPRELDPILVAGDVAVPSEVVSADDSLTAAIDQMGKRGISALPVIEHSTGRVIGVLDRGHLLNAYDRAVREID